MNEKTLKFNNVKVNKKEFHKSKQEIDLDSVDTDKIVVSDKFKHGRPDHQTIMYYLTSNVWLHKIF